ncbi:uncharacterized protein LOC110676894 isoform X1 [Aedes aegypti]|uniref:Uncharacterized protein n=1 Tax=Aedes aegypti TaxID=7159 RepID=A0A6I8U0I2_AEDAE|nr:uncharacterized protein LOC110676894 isoform X1 [Aedes aegypti]
MASGDTNKTAVVQKSRSFGAEFRKFISSPQCPASDIPASTKKARTLQGPGVKLTCETENASVNDSAGSKQNQIHRAVLRNIGNSPKTRPKGTSFDANSHRGFQDVKSKNIPAQVLLKNISVAHKQAVDVYKDNQNIYKAPPKLSLGMTAGMKMHLGISKTSIRSNSSREIFHGTGNVGEKRNISRGSMSKSYGSNGSKNTSTIRAHSSAGQHVKSDDNGSARKHSEMIKQVKHATLNVSSDELCRSDHSTSLSSSTQTAVFESMTNEMFEGLSGISKLEQRPYLPRHSISIRPSLDESRVQKTIEAHSSSTSRYDNSIHHGSTFPPSNPKGKPLRFDMKYKFNAKFNFNYYSAVFNGSMGTKFRNMNDPSIQMNSNQSKQSVSFNESFTNLEVSFSRVITSTPNRVFPIDYSINSSTQHEAMDLTVPSCEQALCLALPKATSQQENPISPLDLRTSRNVTPSEQATIEACSELPIAVRHKLNVYQDQSTAFPREADHDDLDGSAVESDSTSKDADWHPDKNDIEDSEDEDPARLIRTPKAKSEDTDRGDEDLDINSDSEESIDGDPTCLNDLTIYEYFEKYQTLVSEDEFEENSDGEDEIDKPQKRAANNHPLPSKRLCLGLGESNILNNNRDNNISIQGTDNIEKEAVQIKISKQHIRNRNKRNKEKGLEYQRRDGTIVPARSIKPSCNCKLDCGKKYPDATRRKLLSSLLQVKSSGQNQFLASHISVTKTARPKVCLFKYTIYFYYLASVKCTWKHG